MRFDQVHHTRLPESGSISPCACTSKQPGPRRNTRVFCNHITLTMTDDDADTEQAAPAEEHSRAGGRLDELPRAFDDIEVRFTIPSGMKVWWPTKVTRITIRNDDSDIIADATLCYVAAHRMKASEESTYFLPNRAVFTSVGPTSWRSKEEAADAGEGDSGDVDWTVTSRRGRKKRRLGSRRSRRVRESAAASSPAAPLRETANRPDSDQDRTDCLTRTASRSGTHGDTRVPPESEPAEQEHGHADMTSNEGGQDMSWPAQGSLEAKFKELEMKFARLELRVQDKLETKEDNLVSLVVSEKKYMWRFDLMGTISRPVKGNHSTRVTRINSAVQFRPIAIRQLCDFASFQMVATNIGDKYRNGASGTVLFHPALDEIKDENARHNQCSIAFQRGDTLLKWLGVANSARRTAMVRRNERNGRSSVRVLGGLQWDTHNDTLPLNVFVAGSCMPDGLNCESGAEYEHRAVSLESTKWDNSNQSFADVPSMRNRNRGDFVMVNAARCETLFKIVWTTLNDDSARKYTTTGMTTDGLKMGRVEVSVPCTVFYGETLCRQVMNLITASELDECL